MSNLFRKVFSPIIKKLLTLEAGKIAKDARKNASFSEQISKAIVVDPVRDLGETFQVSIRVDSDLVDPGMARAFEFGSGIHSENSPGTYVIKPRNANALAFYWPGGPSAEQLWGSKKFIGVVPGDGRLMFTHVDHPGVKGKHYMGNAVDSNKDTLISKIADATVSVVADSLGPRVEVIR